MRMKMSQAFSVYLPHTAMLKQFFVNEIHVFFFRWKIFQFIKLNTASACNCRSSCKNFSRAHLSQMKTFEIFRKTIPGACKYVECASRRQQFNNSVDPVFLSVRRNLCICSERGQSRLACGCPNQCIHKTHETKLIFNWNYANFCGMHKRNRKWNGFLQCEKALKLNARQTACCTKWIICSCCTKKVIASQKINIELS